MNYPISKNKQGGPMDYLYRGFEVQVSRTYGGGFKGGVDNYCTGSTYYSSEFKIGSASRDRFKQMMDRRIDSTTDET